MAKGRAGVRKPATKLPHLRKKLQKQQVRSKAVKKR